MYKFRYNLILIIWCLTFIPCSSYGQKGEMAAEQKETRQQQKSIEINEIPIRSVEVINETRQAFHDLIPINTIAKLKEKNKRVLASVDTNLLKPINISDPTINFRYLENRRLILIQEQLKIEEEEVKLREVIGSLDQLTARLGQQVTLWKETRKLLLSDSLVRPVPKKVDITIAFLDSSLSLVSFKSSSMMGILEKTIAIGVNIDLYLEKTVALIKAKQMQSFTADHTPLFRLNFKGGYWESITTSFHSLSGVKL